MKFNEQIIRSMVALAETDWTMNEFLEKAYAYFVLRGSPMKEYSVDEIIAKLEVARRAMNNKK